MTFKKGDIVRYKGLHWPIQDFVFDEHIVDDGYNGDCLITQIDSKGYFGLDEPAYSSTLILVSSMGRKLLIESR